MFSQRSKESGLNDISLNITNLRATIKDLKEKIYSDRMNTPDEILRLHHLTALVDALGRIHTRFSYAPVNSKLRTYIIEQIDDCTRMKDRDCAMYIISYLITCLTVMEMVTETDL